MQFYYVQLLCIFKKLQEGSYEIVAMATVTHQCWGSAGDWGHTWSGLAGTLGSALSKDSLGPPHTAYQTKKPNQSAWKQISCDYTADYTDETEY